MALKDSETEKREMSGDSWSEASIPMEESLEEGSLEEARDKKSSRSTNCGPVWYTDVPSKSETMAWLSWRQPITFSLDFPGIVNLDQSSQLERSEALGVGHTPCSRGNLLLFLC